MIDSGLQLQTTGVWAFGYRPTAVKIAHNATGSFYNPCLFIIYDTNSNLIVNEPNYISNTEIVIAWQGFDISIILLYSDDEETPFNVTGITFL